MPYVDELDPLARRVGAINTLVVRDGRWIGANTDVEGFLAPLRGRIALEGRARDASSAPAARRAAVAVALADSGADVTVSARRPRGGAGDRGSWLGGTRRRVPAAGRQLGRAGQRHAGRQRRATGHSPMAGAPLDGALVYDLVYEPADTRCSPTRAPRAARRSAASTC